MAAAELAVATRNETGIQRKTDVTVDPFEPQDWQGLLSLAKMVSQTPFAPKDFQGKPEACAIAMMYGKQLGVPALTALQGIGVINGRPNAFGDLFWAVILSHPEFEDVVEKSDLNSATVKLTRRGRTPKEATFTKAQAEKAGLWGKQGPWTQYPDVMLLWRARTFAARALFADALKGITSSYEAEDSGPIIEGQPVTTQPTQATTPADATAPPPQKITQDEAREFGKAWKASGYQMADAKTNLKEICGVEASLDIPKDKYKAAMQWATRNPSWPNEQSPEEQKARQIFGILEYDLVRQADVIKAHTMPDGTVQWGTLVLSLTAEVNALENQ
ncbi:hypothetical protein DYQ86_15920 [Acidobacteria bacterium AB60]|nr:hypothetical protein DYQ86_15920 [Acidobacteria bacterium AB60]